MADNSWTPYAFVSSTAPRLRQYHNALLTPVIQPILPAPLARTTKRGTTIINYAEDGYEHDEDEDEEENKRRPTGLRSLRREDSAARLDPSEKVGKHTHAPVAVQGIWRDWMANKTQPWKAPSDIHAQAQALMPITLIPIRIAVDVPGWIPPAPFPMPRGQNTSHMDPNLYRSQDLTVPYKLRDQFLWNLHETAITTDQFAVGMVQDLDLPNQAAIATDISRQIRSQLEEYAGVALHPLFHSDSHNASFNGNGTTNATTVAHFSNRGTPGTSATPAPHGHANTYSGVDTPGRAGPDTPSKQAEGSSGGSKATAKATLVATAPEWDGVDDDKYRCVIDLDVNLASTLYTDRLEWSLRHPPGKAEAFAKITCADLGLGGEWVAAIAHAIYEAVLRLKKEACEAGGLVTGWGTMGTGIPSDAAHGAEAGWRYDPEHLADKWEPKITYLSKDETEKRESDRDRQLRRLRRETARFTINAGMAGGPTANGSGVEAEEERMGRGERSKKKRRFRSLTPLARAGTPVGRTTPDVGYGGGGVGSLTDLERLHWRCWHCSIWGTTVWGVRDGPRGPRSLCANCGFLWEKDKKLPRLTKGLHWMDPRPL